MAYCTQTLNGITLDCGNSMGGIKRVFIANYGDIETVSVSGDMVTGITMDSGAKFKSYQFRKNTSNMTSTLTADETTGLNYVTTEVNLVFTKMETSKRIEMAALAQAQLAVIVEDSNGVFWYVTKDEYAAASAGSAETGTSKGDRSAYTLTLTSENLSFPYEISRETVEGLVDGGLSY